MITIIDPSSISPEAIKTDLMEYVQSKPEYEVWRDFYDSSAGMTEIELLSGIGALLSYHSLGARRESYITTRKLTSSAIGLCNTLGYKVNRKSTPRLRLKLDVDASVYWDRTDALGNYTNDRNISLLNSQTISAGINYIDVVVGDWNTTSWTSTSTEDFVILKIDGSNIDNNNDDDTLELLINDSPITLVDYAEDLVGTTVMLRTHYDGVLLIFGDGTLGRRILANDEVVFNYISTLGALGVYVVDPLDIDLNINADVLEVEVLSPGYAGDSLKKLSILPSGYYTTRRRMVTGLDHTFILQSYVGDLISSQYTKVDGECCTIRLSYLFDDEHLMSDNEVNNVLSYLVDFKMVGEEIQLTDPDLVGIDMKLTVVVDEGTTESYIRTQVGLIVDANSWLLGTSFYIGRIVDQVSEIEGVNRIYVERPVSDKSLEYNEYLKLVHLDLTVTSDTTTFVTSTPTNEGYVKQVQFGVTDSAATNKLIDSTTKFQINGTADGTTADKLIDSTAMFQVSGTTTLTTADKLIDSTATFSTDGVTAGDLVYNTTDNTTARVVTVDSEIQLTLTSDIFVSGEGYEVGIRVGDIVYNTTDSTNARVTAIDSVTQITLDDDIFVSGEGYSFGVQVGDIVLNTTDETRTEVLTVDSATQLALDDDIFESGDAYSIYTNI